MPPAGVLRAPSRRDPRPAPWPCLILAADASRLALTLEAPEPADLPRLGEVVADHLRRFAFREDLAIDWLPSD